MSIDKEMVRSAMFNRYKNEINNLLSNTIQFTQSEVTHLESREELRSELRKRREILKNELEISSRAITKNIDVRLWKIRIWGYVQDNHTYAHLVNLDW